LDCNRMNKQYLPKSYVFGKYHLNLFSFIHFKGSYKSPIITGSPIALTLKLNVSNE